MNHRSDEGDDQRHHGGERIELKRNLGAQRARADPRPDPGVDVVDEHPRIRRERQQIAERDAREHE
jgi:hypothetical protein